MAAAVVLGLVLHHGEISPPVQLNDSGLHESTARWASDRVADLENPFDGWWPYLGLGFPQTHQYQSLPHVVAGTVGLATGVATAYDWSLYLLLALFPVAVWGGARLLGLGRWAAAAAGAVAPLAVSITGYGYEAVSYVWQGYGIWPQLWASCLLPVALGLTHRALRNRGSPAWAALAVAATIACHFLTGWLALVLVCLMPLLDPGRIRLAATRAAIVLAGAGLLVAWLALPLVLDASGADYSGYAPGPFYDSHGFSRIMGWLLSGELLDTGRLPVLTILAGVGLLVAVRDARTEITARVVLLLGGVSLVLLFGRPTLGPVADLLPYGSGLFFPRFIMGVHLAGFLLAGIGIAWVGRHLVDALDGRVPLALTAGVCGVALLAVLWPALDERADYAAAGRELMDAQRAAEGIDGRDLDVLVDQLHDTGGRVFAGSSVDWGRSYVVGYVPVYAYLLANDVDAVGFQERVSSIGTIVEPLFDGSDRRHYDLFGVRWVLTPDDRQPDVPATLVARAGRHLLWSVDGVGYGQVVDVTGEVSADAETLRAVAATAMVASDRSSARTLVRWGGDSAATVASQAAGDPGEVTVSVPRPAEGTFAFQVEADRGAYLALAASWHPRWTATVDGVESPVDMVVPGTMAVPVPAGRHAVVFRYEPWESMGIVLAAGVVLFGGVVVGARRWRRAPLASEEA